MSEDSVDLTAMELSTETMTVNPVKIRFTVSERNPRPYLKACGPMRILIGSSAVIKTDYLRAELTSGFDSGQITFEIMYTHQGHIGFISSSHVSLSTFTQVDLQRGRVAFIHSGSQKSTACGFGFVLTYNLYRSEIYHFQIIPGTVKLNVINNQTLLVFPKGFEVITRHHLNTEIKFTAQKSVGYGTSSTAQRNCNLSNTSFPPLVKSQYDLKNELDLQVVYKVLSQPKYGSIIKFSAANKNQLLSWNENITKFTQEEITMGRIAYTFYPNKWSVAVKQSTSLRDQSDIEDEYTVSASIVKRPTIMNMENEKNYNGNNKNDHPTYNIINNYDHTKYLASQIIFCSISISFNYILRYNQNRLLKISPLIVHNGQAGEITLNHINANQLREFLENNGSESRSLKISKTPKHGTLWLGSNMMKPGSIIPGVFSGMLVEKLVYQHDGSSVKEDDFELLVYQLNRSLRSYEQPIVFPIQIVPNFNASLNLIRPLSQINTDSLSIKNTKLIIVEMNDYVTISNEHIFVQHEFIQPQFIYIHFKILPKYGNLFYSYNSFKQEHEVLLPECEILHKITQNDINLKRLRYFANNVDNNKRNRNIPIYDSVTFDVYQNEYPNLQLKKLTGILEFQIILNNFALNDSVQLDLMQNETKLWLDTEMLNLQLSRWRNYHYDYQTNHTLFFVIQEMPNYGKIFVDTIPVYGFSYAQLEQKRVYYAKTSYSTYSDSFTIEIVKYLCGVNLRSRSIILNLRDDYKQNFINQVSSQRSPYITFTVNILVKALVSIDTIYVTPGKMTKIIAENLKINKFSEFLQMYNIPNFKQPKIYQKSMPVTMFTFPTGTILKSGRFYIDDRLVISIGYLNDKLSSSINISLQDFLSNNVYFEAYRINDESLEIYEETIPFIFTLGTFINSQTYLTFSNPIFIQPGYGDLKISIKNIFFSTRSNNNHSNNDSMNQSVSSSSALSSTVKSDQNSKYFGTSKIAFTIAGLALSLAFISVVIICSISCCIYKRKNKAGKSLINKSNSSEKHVSTPYSMVTTTLSRGIINSPNKYILKSNRDSIELCSNKQREESEKLYSDEQVNSPILSNKLTRVTFDNNVSINHIIPVDSIVPSSQDYSCSCDFSGAVVYWTTDMAIDTALSHIGCQSDSNVFNCNIHNSNHTFHLFSTSETNKPPVISTPLSSNVLHMQEDTEQCFSPVLLAQLPSDNLNIPHLTFLSSPDTTKQINVDIVPYQSQFTCKNNVEDNKNNPKHNHESIQVSSEIMNVDNFKNTDKMNESHCVESVCNESPNGSSIMKPMTYVLSNIYDKHFDMNYMNQMV
ncbi:chondroitin sulfate proteoglycan 4-like [Schistosoma japonicum]|uniref:Chondroitin sulfate proteoglycan 4-like n=1 Tax=Schistosoma japonicum TaxID=6182 RepID=A0A4Z2CS32_SCHJA|nr:chondroitin sulfate proteoglycan 4-like [Schistosoma japonicum]